MSRWTPLLRDRRGTAAVELALVAPMLLFLTFGATELGRYFWSEHQLVKAVRDASIFVSRRPIDDFNCGTSAINANTVTSARNLVRTGVMAGGSDKLPHWNDAGASINLSLTCVTSAGGTSLAGIYSGNGNNVPLVTITAIVPYQLILYGYGLRGSYQLRATQQAVVVAA